MCCFAKPVDLVANTRIFCRLTGRGTQMLAYQMEYASKLPNAMIVPLPTPSGADQTAVRFISLEQDPWFFDHLMKGFPWIAGWGLGCSGGPEEMGAVAASIEVHQVGSFIASFVPRLDDFDRLDPQFTISREVWDQIPAYQDYGFIVFQLNELAGEPHPMALEFDTRFEDKTYFPTVHIHDGQVHQTEAFDHQLFLQHGGWDGLVGDYQNRSVADRSTGWVRSKRRASDFMPDIGANAMVAADLLVHRRDLSGTLVNEDQILEIAGDPAVAGWAVGGLRGWMPWLIGGTCIAWWLHRRGRLRKTGFDHE